MEALVKVRENKAVRNSKRTSLTAKDLGLLQIKSAIEAVKRGNYAF